MCLGELQRVFTSVIIAFKFHQFWIGVAADCGKAKGGQEVEENRGTSRKNVRRGRFSSQKAFAQWTRTRIWI